MSLLCIKKQEGIKEPETVRDSDTVFGMFSETKLAG